VERQNDVFDDVHSKGGLSDRWTCGQHDHLLGVQPASQSVNVGKAGRSRWLGIRPTVRGTAMNPVDHPHGGGEGNQPIGLRYPKTIWGKHALGVKTRKKHNSDRLIVKRRPGRQ